MIHSGFVAAVVVTLSLMGLGCIGVDSLEKTTENSQTSCNPVPLLCQDQCNVCQNVCEEECKVHKDCPQCNADCVTLYLECP